MLGIVRERIHDIKDVPSAFLVLKSSSIPALKGEKVEISKESWPSIVDQLSTFEVEEIGYKQARETLPRPMVSGCCHLSDVCSQLHGTTPSLRV